MRNVLQVRNGAAARTALSVVLVMAVISGCTSTKRVTAPRSGATVRIEYAVPVAIIMQTRRKEVVHMPQVRVLYARILEVRGDSMDVRVVTTRPYNRHVEQATATIQHSGNGAPASTWTSRSMSAGKTAALIFLPFFIIAVGFAVNPM